MASDERHDPMAINWTNVNVPTILAVGGAVWAIFTYIGDIKNGQDRMEEYRVTRSAQTDKEFAMVKATIAEIQGSTSNIPYRVGVIERGLEEAGKRTDRLSEIVLQNMDGLKRDMTAIGVKLEVLSSKFDDQFPRTQKTKLERQDVPQYN